MNIDQKLTAIRDVIQRDVGNRGLARDPNDNLITACPDDFASACNELAFADDPAVGVVTGFFIPTAVPPAFETDGPLGAVFLRRTSRMLGISMHILTDTACVKAVEAGCAFAGIQNEEVWELPRTNADTAAYWPFEHLAVSHILALERVGPAKDGCCYTMRGRDVTNSVAPAHLLFDPDYRPPPELFAADAHSSKHASIGIGDGGNEIGMGKIPHDTIVRNIPNGDLIHCRVATDHLIVAGVSNWGAYALAAGVALLRGVKLPAELFDPERERAILQTMVDAGPLVDGVTGLQTATVDGLSWDEYIRPLQEIARIVEA